MRYIFSFRSRSAAMNFYDDLRREGIRGTIVNTPRELGFGCGLSVRVEADELLSAKRVLGAFRSERFAGIHEVDTRGEIVGRIL